MGLAACTLACVLLFLPLPGQAQSQTPLHLADDNTEVRRISFRFVDSQTFPESLLQEQIATREPGFFDRLRRVVPLMEPRLYPLDPIELQRDVVRLRQFYNQRGFLEPEIDYPASQLDTDNNTIHVIFTIEEGPPLIIESMDFFDSEGNHVSTLFEEGLLERWHRLRARIGDQQGERYSETERYSIEDEILAWLREHGFAFASVSSTSEIHRETNSADLRFSIDPGPQARFGEIIIEGNEHVDDETIIRQLPFRPGELYSHQRFNRGQRDLFQLRLFRTVLADIPSQEQDSLVTVRYRVREARPRYLSAETGYSREAGIEMAGEWNHRNFLGGARHLTLGSTIHTGLLAQLPAAYGELDPPLLLETSASLRQPYLGVRGLSGLIRPFVEFERDPFFEPSDEVLGINRTQFGATTQLIYEFLPFRLLTLNYTLSRTGLFTTRQAEPDPDDELMSESNNFSRSVLSLNGTFGQLDDFFERREGFLIQPFVEVAGALLPTAILQPGLEYYQLGGEASVYLPLIHGVDGGARLSVGRTWPIGASRRALFGDDAFPRSRYRDRFRSAGVIFNVGGADDVRGWSRGLIGPQTIDRVEFLRDENDEIVLEENAEGELVPVTVNNWFEPVGGLSRLALNLEARMPFPGLGEAWRLATFLDAGQVSSSLEDGRVVDNGSLRIHPDAFQFGTGLGIRYRTPVGFLRLDLAYKINPDPRDLQDAREVFLWANRENHPIFDQIDFQPEPPREHFIRRFNIHISIGQAF